MGKWAQSRLKAVLEAMAALVLRRHPDIWRAVI